MKTEKKIVQTNKVRGAAKVADLCESNGTVSFIVYDGRKQEIESSVVIEDTVYEPNVTKKEEYVFLPDGSGDSRKAEELYSDCLSLVKEAINHPNEWVQHVVALYILASWNYDLYSEISYLAFTGLPGSGKSAGLKTVWALSFAGMMFSGGGSDSSIFRTIHKMRGTFCSDEAKGENADQLYRDMFNAGNQAHGVVHRTRINPKTGEYTVDSYSVFSPKVTASLYISPDEMIQSRTIEVVMPPPKKGILLDGVLDNPDWKKRADKFRRDACLYRQKRAIGELSSPRTAEDAKNLAISFELNPREYQVFKWLLREAPSEKSLEHLFTAIKYRREVRRGSQDNNSDACVLRAAYALLIGAEPESFVDHMRNRGRSVRTKQKRVLLSAIEELAKHWGYRDVTTQFVGKTLRRTGITTRPCFDGVYVMTSAQDVRDVCVRLGLEDPEASVASGSSDKEGL